jgi:hypothetical protein
MGSDKTKRVKMLDGAIIHCEEYIAPGVIQGPSGWASLMIELVERYVEGIGHQCLMEECTPDMVWYRLMRHANACWIVIRDPIYFFSDRIEYGNEDDVKLIKKNKDVLNPHCNVEEILKPVFRWIDGLINGGTSRLATAPGSNPGEP